MGNKNNSHYFGIGTFFTILAYLIPMAIFILLFVLRFNGYIDWPWFIVIIPGAISLIMIITTIIALNYVHMLFRSIYD